MSKTSKVKKLCVCASSWHYPASFYEMIAKQKLPKGWEMDLFCVAHRSPTSAQAEKKGREFTGDRAYLDERLYTSVISKLKIKKLGWNYKEYPNTIGDWGNSNQWLEENDYKQYDLLLFTHDDNLILNDTWFKDIIEDGAFEEWGILCNSVGAPKGWIRGSCEFFKPWVIEKMGGKFDLSDVTLNREGHTLASENLEELNNWNFTIHKTMDFIEKEDIPMGFLSPCYRVSAYCIEGERGYISNTHGANTAEEDLGLEHLKQYGIL